MFNTKQKDKGASLVVQMVKSRPAMMVRSLGWEDPLEEGMATHSSIPAWEIPWTEEPGRLQSTGSQRVTKHSTEEDFIHLLHISRGRIQLAVDKFIQYRAFKKEPSVLKTLC